MNISAKGKGFRELNEEIADTLRKESRVELTGVEGHRYIGAGVEKGCTIRIHGTPGNDLGCYMDGASIEVFGNSQDAVGNTMNCGRIVVHGHAGDALGYAMRGGEIFVEENVGYRCGIHMKEFGEARPVIVIGGTAGAFLGEYMAGGVIIVFGQSDEEVQSPAAGYCATGMHGGIMYLRGKVPAENFSSTVVVEECTEEDVAFVQRYADTFAELFGRGPGELHAEDFVKVRPASARPYGNLYVRN